jgi:hypothetical protein
MYRHKQEAREAREQAEVAEVERYAAQKHAAEAEALLEPITAELEHARWGLGGRVRKPTDPPIYLMPPGQEKTGCCDDARLAWMEVANEAARILRAAGMGASADGIHPETRQANQGYQGTVPFPPPNPNM